jgi:flagellar biosynthetic protein FliR
MAYDGLTTEAAYLVLEVSRTSGVIMVAPLTWVAAPTRSKVALALLLAFVAHSVPPRPIDSLFSVAFGVPFELMIGVGMGLVVRFILAAVEIAGEVVSPMLGLGVAGLFDPKTQTSESAFSRILRYFAMLLTIALGLHRVVIAGLIASFRVLPPGSITDPHLATEVLVHLSVAAIATGVRLALPLLAVLFVMQVGLAFVSRAAPSMQIFSVGFAVTLAGGLGTLLFALPDVTRELVETLSETGPYLERFVAALVGG